MSDTSISQRHQGGPGPPHAQQQKQKQQQQQMLPSYLPSGGGAVSRHGGPGASGVVATSHQGTAGLAAGTGVGRAGETGAGAVGQGLRMEHPGMGFVPAASFQVICAGDGNATRSAMAAPGYYPYHSVASLYPYAMVGAQGAGAPAAASAAGVGVRGLDPERLPPANRAVALSRSTPTTVTSSAMESAWGVQYSHAPTWPAVSEQAAKNCHFATMASPLQGGTGAASFPSSTVSNAMTIASTSPASSSKAATKSNASTSLSAANAPAQAAPAVAAAGAPAADCGADGHEPTNGTGEVSTPVVAGKCPEGLAPAEIESVAGREQQTSAAAGGTGGGLEDDDTNGEYDVDGAGKRRRLTAEERLQRSRERNQLHARKTRQRKKAQLQLLMNRSADLQAEQQRLRQAITDRRTASILLGMSGSEDAQADGETSKNKASRDHPPALAAMSGRMPRAGMLAALESDDTGEGSGKGAGGNGSDDLGSENTESTAGTSSSGRTTLSESTSSDGAIGGGDGGVESAAEKLPKVGNPGDTERLLELSQKTRSECTPEELEQIRRERNRMHAKRTRDRKKLHLEATEGMIARLEQENRKLRDSMKAMGSSSSSSNSGNKGSKASGGGSCSSVTGGSGADAAPKAPATPPSSTISPSADGCVPGAYAQHSRHGPPHSATQRGSSDTQVHYAASAPLSQLSTQYSDHNTFLPQGHPLIHQQLHGHPGHLYPAQHHLPHGSVPAPPHHLMQQLHSAATHPSHIAYYPHGLDASNRSIGGSVGNGGGGGGGGGGGRGSMNGGLVKPEMASFTSGGRISSMSYLGHSNPNYPHHARPHHPQQLLAHHNSSVFTSPPLGAGKPHAMSSTPLPHSQPGQHQYVYPLSEPRGYNGWDPTHAHGHAAPPGATAAAAAVAAAAAAFSSGWVSGPSFGVEGSGGAMPAAMAAAAAHLQQQESNAKPASSICEAETEGGRGNNETVETGERRVTGGVDGQQNWFANAATTDRAAVSANGGSTSTSTSKKTGKPSRPSSSSSSSCSAAGNGTARHLARARADTARAAAAAATTDPTGVHEGGHDDIIVEERREEQEDEDSQQAHPATADQHKLDRDLSRGCQEAWQKVRRQRHAKRKRGHHSDIGGGSSGSRVSGDCAGPGSLLSSSSASAASQGEEDSGSEREGSGGEGSESSSSSSWLESSESSLLPASTTSSEGGRGGRDSLMRSSGSDSARDSPSVSASCGSSGSDEGAGSGGDDDRREEDGGDGLNRKDGSGGGGPSRKKLARRCVCVFACVFLLVNCNLFSVLLPSSRALCC